MGHLFIDQVLLSAKFNDTVEDVAIQVDHLTSHCDVFLLLVFDLDRHLVVVFLRAVATIFVPLRLVSWLRLLVLHDILYFGLIFALH